MFLRLFLRQALARCGCRSYRGVENSFSLHVTLSLILLALFNSLQNCDTDKAKSFVAAHLIVGEERSNSERARLPSNVTVGLSHRRAGIPEKNGYSSFTRRRLLALSSSDVRPASDKNPSAEAAIAEADRLRAEWKERSLRGAIEKYKESLSYWRSYGDQRNEARTLKKIGEIYMLFGLNKEALIHYAQALKLSRFTEDVPLQTEILNARCSIYAFQGEKAQALQACNEAQRLSQLVGDLRGKGQALNNTGEAEYFSDMKKALNLFEQALALSRTAGDQRIEAQALTNIGYVRSDWSDLQEASTSFSQALELWRRVGDLSGEARTINALGVVHSKLGEKQKALDEHTKAKDFFQGIGNRPGELTALTGIGFVYDSLGQKEKALEQYNKALEICRAVGQREGELVLLIHVGNVQDALGTKKEALKSYNQALHLSVVLGDRRMQAYSLSFIGEIHEALGLSSKPLAYYLRALHLSRSVEDKMGEAFLLNKIASVFERQGEHEKALNNYESALSLLVIIKDRQGEAFARYNLCRLYRKQGRFDEAKFEIEKSLHIIESLRTNVGSHELRLSYFASVHQYYSLYIDLLMQMHKRQPANNLDVIAFQASGRARTRNMLDLLVEAHADIYESIDPILREKEKTQRQTLNAKSERQIRLLSGSHSDDEASALEKEISDLSFAYEELRAQIRELNPRHATLVDPAPLSLKEVQDMLDEDSLLLEYALGEKQSYVWAVSKSEFKTYELPNKDKIEESARSLYGLLTSRQRKRGETLAEYETRGKEIDEQYWRQASELGSLILDPVRSQLGTKRLLVVSDGALLLIPFGALSLSSPSAEAILGTSPANSAQPLILEHEIVNLPSVSAFAILRRMNSQRQRAAKDVLVIADPVFERDDPRFESNIAGAASKKPSDIAVVHQATSEVGLIEPAGRIPRLLGSAQEAADIVKIAGTGAAVKVVGFKANLESLKDFKQGQFRIVHFGTHGVFNGEHAELSGIILSLYSEQGEPQAGFLGLHEVYNLNLPVELVVLSACNTAVGKEIRGEGLVGLTRGFMYAGATGVIASLWKVDDDATAELMKDFYSALLQEGLSPSAALRKAQIKMWQVDRRRSPYYWAAFVFQGEYQPSSRFTEVKRGHIVGAAVAILLASIIAWYGVRRNALFFTKR